MDATLQTGLRGLDEALGGLPDGSLVEVYGPPASGKTSLTLGLARQAGAAALVLPERPHPKRIADVLGSAVDSVLVARPAGFEAQASAVQRACTLLADGRVDYVGLDSLTFLYRFEKLSTTQALRTLFEQVRRLRAAARDGDGTAVFTNQVRGSDDGWAALGGPAIAHAADVIVALEPLEGPYRRLRVEKHPYEASGATFEARITDAGLT